MKCPCGSDLEQNACCQPIIDGKTPAPTAEALMRARYTAHVVAAIPFLEASLSPEARDGFDAAEVRKWATQSEWMGLRILSSSEKARRGTVKFVATYRANGKVLEHHETATFRKDEEDGRWYFLDADAQVREKPEDEEPIEAVTTIVREGPKVGRNDPCPCGSGKKYKKCCGK